MNQEMKVVKLKDYIQRVENGDISLEVSIQRSNDQWSIAQQSYLIESLLKDYPVPPIYTVDHEGAQTVIDGLQRTTAIRGFYNDEYTLEGVDEAFCGKKFSELDDQYKRRFLEYELCLMDEGEVDDEKLVEMFLRLNSGKMLTKVQKTRGILGNAVAGWGKDMCRHPLFTKLAKFTDRQLKDDAPLECLLQGILLIHGCLGDSNGDMYPWKKIREMKCRNIVTRFFQRLPRRSLTATVR